LKHCPADKSWRLTISPYQVGASMLGLPLARSTTVELGYSVESLVVPAVSELISERGVPEEQAVVSRRNIRQITLCRTGSG